MRRVRRTALRADLAGDQVVVAREGQQVGRGIEVDGEADGCHYSFGGGKDSLFGDTKAYGPDAIHFFTRQKAITSRWLDPARRHQLGLPDELTRGTFATAGAAGSRRG